MQPLQRSYAINEERIEAMISKGSLSSLYDESKVYELENKTEALTDKEQKKLEKYLRETGERNNYITMVGGAPVTQRWAEKIGADGYSDSARDAVSKALELISKKNKDR